MKSDTENTKIKILNHASSLFISIGVRNVTMDLLASDLGISKRTIYELFKNKDELVIECVRFMIMKEIDEHMQIIENTENVVEAIFLITQRQQQRRQGFTKVFVDDIKKYFPVVQASFYSSKSDLKKFSASFTLLERGMKQHIFRKDLKIELVDNFLHEIVTIIHTSDRIRLLCPEPKDMINSILLPYFRGICTEKGLDLMNKYFSESNDPAN